MHALNDSKLWVFNAFSVSIICYYWDFVFGVVYYLSLRVQYFECVSCFANSACHVDERIENFLANFESRLVEMPQSELQTRVGSLIKLKQRPDVSLEEEVARNWNEILTEEYLFDRIDKEVIMKETTSSLLPVHEFVNLPAIIYFSGTTFIKHSIARVARLLPALHLIQWQLWHPQIVHASEYSILSS